MKSIIVSFAPLVRKVKRISDTVYEDKLTVFAAQTSFYICISAIPFIMLLLSLSRRIAPAFVDDMMNVLRELIPDNSAELFDHVRDEISAKADIPLISTAAVTTLWSASRGVWAVIRGVSEVYKTQVRGNFVVNIIHSLVYTVIFMASIIASFLLFLFDSSVRGALAAAVGETKMLSSFFRFRSLILFFVLALFFTLIYYAVSKGAFFIPSYKKKTSSAPSGFARHIPGALLASLGWILFSFFYSLYIKCFSRFSYIYGSLTAIVFFMLWMYFCIVILLAGAEMNKLLFEDREGM